MDKAKIELRKDFGDKVLVNKSDFAYSNDTVDIDEKDAVLTKIINIILAEKIQAQVLQHQKLSKR